jgi:hypothetical protein
MEVRARQAPTGTGWRGDLKRCEVSGSIVAVLELLLARRAALARCGEISIQEALNM